MAINLFNFLKEDVRLLHFENCLYKIKILYEDQDKLCKVVPPFLQKDSHEDIEKVIRAVLYILKKQGGFHKIQTEKFIVTVKTKPWKAVRKIRFKLKGGDIKVHPFMIILNLKLKSLPKLLELACHSSKNISVHTPMSDRLNELKNLALNSKACVMLDKINLPQKKNGESDRTANQNGYHECARLPSTSESDRNLIENKNSVDLPSTSQTYSISMNVNVEPPVERTLNEKNITPFREVNNPLNYGQSPVISQLDIVETDKNKADSENTNENKVVQHKRKLKALISQQPAHRRLLHSKSSVLSLRSRSLRQKNLLQSSKEVTSQIKSVNAKQRRQNLVKADYENESQRLNHHLQHIANIEHRRSLRIHQNKTKRNVSEEQVQTRSQNACSKVKITKTLINQQYAHKQSPQSKSSVLSLRSRSLRQRNLLQSSKEVTSQDRNINTNKRIQNIVKAGDKNESRRLTHYLRQAITNTEHRGFPRNHQNTTFNSPGINVSQLNLIRNDRHFIEQEELAEDMKLQQLAKSSPDSKTKNKSKERRSSIGMWGFMENFISPVKDIFSNTNN